MAYGQAAAQWFAREAGPAAFRRWIDGGIAAQREQACAFARFGLADVLAEIPDSGTRAATVAAVAREAGRHLYAGPIAALAATGLLGVADAAVGASVVWVRDAVAVDVTMESFAEPVRLPPTPYADLADVLWLTAGADEPWIFAVMLGESARVESVADADGTRIGVLLHVRRAGCTPVAVTKPVGAARQEIEELGWLATCARLIGAAERAGELARDHLLARRQFNRPLAAFQVLQHQAVDRFLDVTLAASLLDQVLRHWGRAHERRPVLHALKAFAATAALEAGKTAVQHFGASGFAHDGDVGLYLRHVVALAARGGDALEHRRLFGSAARTLLA